VMQARQKPPANIAQPLAQADAARRQAEEQARAEFSRDQAQAAAAEEEAALRQQQVRQRQALDDQQQALASRRGAPDYSSRNFGAGSAPFGNALVNEPVPNASNAFDEQPVGGGSAPAMADPPSGGGARGFGGGGGLDDGPGRGGGGGGFEARDDMDQSFDRDSGFGGASKKPPAAAAAQASSGGFPPRGRPSTAAAPADDGWGGQSLGDAFAPKKAPPKGGGMGGGGNAGGSKPPPVAGGDCGKSPDEICKWVRSLPQSHVPEKAQEALCACVEEQGLSSKAFTDFVQKVPPEVCAPKNAMKLKTAWNNVLAEVAAKEVAGANLEANNKVAKATSMVV